MMHYIPEERENGTAFLETEWDDRFANKTETVFSQCNGYMGVRAALPVRTLEECRGTFIAGLYHKASEFETSELINCPDVTENELTLNGEKIYVDRCRVEAFQRSLSMENGELEIKMTLLSAKGQRLTIGVRRFASRKNRHLFVQELTVRPMDGGTLTLSTGINGQITNSGAGHFARTDARVFEKKYMYTANICDDGQELYLMTALKAKEEAARSFFYLKRKSIYESREFSLGKGEAVTICKAALFSTKDDPDHLDEKQMQDMTEEALEKGYETLKKEHEECCGQLWKYARVRLGGVSPEEQAAVDFAIYHILGMIPSYTSEYSIAAKGLTGEGYKGHVFWDAELFVMPFFTAVFPEMARNLLCYRYKGLDGARKKAREYGYEGAMYPWEAAKSGEEETPLLAALNIHTGVANKIWSGIKEHHVTADIMYALKQYLMATKDETFIREYGREMLIETAMFWVSRSVDKGERIELLDIIGPDEYTEHVDNNAYSNYMAKLNVSLALEMTEQLKETDPRGYQTLNERYDLKTWEKKWEDFRKRIYLPVPNEQGIIPQDDTFLKKTEIPDIEKYRTSDVKQSVLLDYSRDEIVNMQVLKQADVVMLLNLMPDAFAPEIVRKNVEYYEVRTIHDSSLSYCAHAIATARIGEKEQADAFFQKALEIDLNENYKDSVDGIHSASLGGIWNSLIQGYAGVEYTEEGLSITPHLPKRMEKLEFFQKLRGTYYRIAIYQDKVEIFPQGPAGEETFRVYGKAYQVEKPVTIYKKAFIFDLDGVLVDTAKYHYLAWKKLAAGLGFDFPIAYNERLKGVSRMASLEVVLEAGGIDGLSIEEKEALAEKKNNMYLEMIAGLTEENILPGIQNFLKKIKEDGFLIGLGSASKSGRMIIEKLGLLPLFDVVVDGHQAVRPKPDPQVFLLAGEGLGVPVSNCIVVEDAKAGVEAALAAGMHVIGIGSEEQLHCADIVLSGTDKLLEVDYGRLIEKRNE